jgi:phosphatidylglycerophosphate synthase
MGIYSTKSRWQRILDPAVAICVRRRIHPDWFTYGALVISLVAAFAFYRAGTARWWLLLAAPCVLIRLGLNLMDGQVARGMGLDDPWGEVKNEFGDRIADAAVFLGISFGGYADPSVVALALSLVLCVSYLGILGKALGGPRVYGGVFGKGDRMISLAVFSLYPLLSGNLESYNWYLVFAAGASAVTIIQRGRIIHEYQQSAVQ